MNATRRKFLFSVDEMDLASNSYSKEEIRAGKLEAVERLAQILRDAGVTVAEIEAADEEWLLADLRWRTKSVRTKS